MSSNNETLAAPSAQENEDFDRKRRAEAVSSYPPAKRQNSSSSPLASQEHSPRKRTGSKSAAMELPSSPMNKDTNDGQENDMDNSDIVTVYQKQAIWMQMQEYKRRLERCESRYLKLQNKNAAFKQSNGVVARHLTEIFDTVTLSARRLDSVDTLGDVNTVYGDTSRSRFLRQLLSTDLAQVEAGLSEQIRKINDVIVMVSTRVQAVANSRFENVEEQSELAKTVKKQEALIDDLQNKFQSLSSENVTLKSDIEILRQRVEEQDEDAEQTATQLQYAEKKLDRMKFAASAKAASNVNNNTNNSSAPNPPPLPDEINLINSEPAILAESRLKALEELRGAKLALQLELDELKIQAGTIQEEKVKESPLYKNLEAEFQYHRSENIILKSRMDQMTQELEELQAERRTFMEKVVDEEAARRKQLEAEIRKLESDLTRVRGNRDHLQHNLDIRIAKDDAEFAQIEEIKIIANTRKDRITCLESDLRRLKMKIAANMGDNDLLEFFNAEDGSSFKELFEKFRQSEKRRQEIESEIELYKAKDTTGSAEVNYQKEIKLLQKRLTDYESTFGILPDETHSMEDKIAHLSEFLKERDKRIKELEIRCQFFEKTENQLTGEVEKIANAWNELEQQNSRKVFNLTEKEEQIVRLIAERTKFDQKCAMLTKEKNTNSNLAIARKKLSDKQLEQIRKLEDMQKTLTQKLSAREKELAAVNAVMDLHKRRASEYLQQVVGLKDKIEAVSNEFNKIKDLLRERTRALEIESKMKQRLAENYETIKQKYEHSQEREVSGDSLLARQVDDYKRLLKCSSCSTNFKSHCIMKCMHVFCKNCVDELIRVRQRKCPTCYATFSQQDVRQIYL